MTEQRGKERRSKQLAFSLVAIVVSGLAIYMSARSMDDSRWGGPTVEERIRDIQNSDIPPKAKEIALAHLRYGARQPSPK